MHDALLPPGFGIPPPYLKCQWHITIPVPLCCAVWGAATGKPVRNVMSSAFGCTLQRGTDIGPLIPHIGIGPAFPNLLYPVILATSASKSEFGVASVYAGGDVVAIACMGAIGVPCVNLNLNCWGLPFPPMPSGIVLAYNTVCVDASWWDLVIGALNMILDMLVQYVIGRIFAGRRFDRFLTLAPNYIPGVANAFMRNVGQRGFFYQAASAFVDDIAKVLGGIIVGSPLGLGSINLLQLAWPDTPVAINPGGAAPGALSNLLDGAQKNYLMNNTIEDYPTTDFQF
jgi:hypothetical protein